MSEHIRRLISPFVLGAMFLVSLFLSQIFNAHLIFIAVGTAISVAISHLAWPTSIVTVALVMIVVATLVPISAMYVVANSGQESASIVEILSLLVRWKNAIPLVTAVTVAYFLKHRPF